jgi:hypothetical protein
MSASDTTQQATEPASNGRQFWRPPPDEVLTWFRPPEGIVPTRPRPLEATLTAHAFAFGLTHGLISLYLPLSEVRARIVDGQFYLAAVPSPLADRDLNAQMRRVRDSSLRFSRNLRASWERIGRSEAEEYNTRLAAFPPADASDAEVAAGLPMLRRNRGNQWFITIRMAFATSAMLRARGGDFPQDDAVAVLADARALVVQRGAAELEAAIRRVGERLVRSGCIATPDDVYWLDIDEAQAALARGGDQRSLVESHRAEAANRPETAAPEMIGPPLPTDAPRMYLLGEILALIAGGDLRDQPSSAASSDSLS